MEKSEYSQLIIENRLNELLNINDLDDLVKYKYQDKYLLEYLLENNIHTIIMEAYLINSNKWIKIYLKHHLTEPIVKAHLMELLKPYHNKLLLEEVLKLMNDKERMMLYQNIKYNDFWYFHHVEPEIIDIYKKYGINLKPSFIKYPRIDKSNLECNEKLNNLFEKLKKTFKSIDDKSFEYIISDFKRKTKYDLERTCYDIEKLIDIKKDYPRFKLKILGSNYHDENIPFDDGAYFVYEHSCGLMINKYSLDTLTHEYSHLLFDNFDSIDVSLYNKIFKLEKKRIINDETTEKVIRYLREFYIRYDYMTNVFKELYYYEIKRQHQSTKKYFNSIKNDILKNKPDYISYSQTKFDVYTKDENVDTMVVNMLTNELIDFIDINIFNYFYEEICLQNLLDSLYEGRLHSGELGIKSSIGHPKLYFKEDDYASFDECIANYEVIKYSPKSKIIIRKLREIVGDQLVNIFDWYIDDNRKKDNYELKKER